MSMADNKINSAHNNHNDNDEKNNNNNNNNNTGTVTINGNTNARFFNIQQRITDCGKNNVWGVDTRLAFDANNNPVVYLVTGSNDGKVRLYQTQPLTQNFNKLKSPFVLTDILSGHSKRVHGVKFAPIYTSHPPPEQQEQLNNQPPVVLVSVGYDMNAIVWDITDMYHTKILKVLRHTTKIWALSFAPKAQYMATGCENGHVRIYDSQFRIWSVCAHSPAVCAVAFHPTSPVLLAVGYEKGDICLWDIKHKSSSLICILEGHTKDIGLCNGLAFLSVTTLLSVAKDCTVRLWDINTKQCIRTITHARSCVCVVPISSTLFATGCDDGMIRLYQKTHNYTSVLDTIANCVGPILSLTSLALPLDNGNLIAFGTAHGHVGVYVGEKQESELVDQLFLYHKRSHQILQDINNQTQQLDKDLTKLQECAFPDFHKELACILKTVSMVQKTCNSKYVQRLHPYLVNALSTHQTLTNAVRIASTGLHQIPWTYVVRRFSDVRESVQSLQQWLNDLQSFTSDSFQLLQFYDKEIKDRLEIFQRCKSQVTKILQGITESVENVRKSTHNFDTAVANRSKVMTCAHAESKTLSETLHTNLKKIDHQLSVLKTESTGSNPTTSWKDNKASEKECTAFVNKTAKFLDNEMRSSAQLIQAVLAQKKLSYSENVIQIEESLTFAKKPSISTLQSMQSSDDRLRVVCAKFLKQVNSFAAEMIRSQVRAKYLFAFRQHFVSNRKKNMRSRFDALSVQTRSLLARLRKLEHKLERYKTLLPSISKLESDLEQFHEACSQSIMDIDVTSTELAFLRSKLTRLKRKKAVSKTVDHSAAVRALQIQVEESAKEMEELKSEYRRHRQGIRGILREGTMVLATGWFPELCNFDEVAFPGLDAALRKDLVMDRELMDYTDRKPLLENDTKNRRLFIATLDERRVVLKRFHLSNMNDYKSLRRSLRAVSKLDHPGIIKISGVFKSNDECYLEMPYFRCGTLENWNKTAVAKQQHVEYERNVCYIIQRLLEAVSYLHTNGLVHGDIKPSNTLMTSHGAPVLADFELSTVVMMSTNKSQNTTESQSTVTSISGGTVQYMPPEALAGVFDIRYKRLPNGGYVSDPDGELLGVLSSKDLKLRSMLLKARDCWALGCVCFCLCRKGPIKKLSDRFAMDVFTQYRKDNSLIAFGNAMRTKMQERLVAALLNIDPLKRITAAKALELDYFDNARYSSLTAMNRARIEKKISAHNNLPSKTFDAGLEQCLRALPKGMYELNPGHGFVHHLLHNEACAAFLKSLANKLFRIVKVVVNVNPVLLAQFCKQREVLVGYAKKRKGDVKGVREEWLFHQTNVKNTLSICKEGFKLKKFGTGADANLDMNDQGFFGRGHYFTHYVEYAQRYADLVDHGFLSNEDASEEFQVLLCRVLTGVSKLVSKHTKGKACAVSVCGGFSDHDSHISPGGKEVVIFRDAQILPLFQIFYLSKGQKSMQFE